jgi:hypothetical protein
MVCAIFTVFGMLCRGRPQGFGPLCLTPHLFAAPLGGVKMNDAIGRGTDRLPRGFWLTDLLRDGVRRFQL